jgi:hypothetical protein
MSTHLAEAELADSVLVEETVRPSAVWFTDDFADNDRRLPAARGVIIAMMISTPFWVLVGVAIYLLT